MTNQTTFADRLNKILQQKKISGSELARQSGFTRAFISRIKNGLHERLNYDTAKKLSDALKIPVETLFTGDEYKNIQKFATVTKFAPILKWEDVQTWLTQGENMQCAEALNYVAVPQNKDCFVLEIINDSMQSDGITFNIGDYVIVERLGLPNEGDFIVCKTPQNDEPILRQYLREGGKTILKPLNDKYETKIVNREDVMIFGVVIERRIVLKK